MQHACPGLINALFSGQRSHRPRGIEVTGISEMSVAQLHLLHGRQGAWQAAHMRYQRQLTANGDRV
jgi:hypothetical protein